MGWAAPIPRICRLARVGDVDRAAAEPLGDVGEALRLISRQDAARKAQAQHKRVLVRRDVEQSVEFVEEDFGAFREAASSGVRRHLVPHVEGVLRPLRHFLRDERAAGGERPVLREAMDYRRVVARRRLARGRGKIRRGRCRAIGQRDAALFGKPGDKPFEILLLIFGKA